MPQFFIVPAMNGQPPTLNVPSPVTPIKHKIQRDFEQFHQTNPWVLTELERLASELVSSGHRKIGIGMLFEVLRWHVLVGRSTADPNSDFKLNNNYRSRYVRYMIQRNPGWASHFETRELKAI